MDRKNRVPRGLVAQRGFTLIEMLIVVGIIVIVAMTAGAFALGQRNYEIKAAGDRFDSLIDAAKAIARSSGNGATLTVVKGPNNSGFVARVMYGRPNNFSAMTYANMPALESGASIKETSDLNTEPPFAIFVNSRGSMSAAAGWVYPTSGAIAQEPTCNAAITVQFYENGQKLQAGVSGASRGLSCAGYTAVNTPLVAIVTPGPYSTPTPYTPIVVRPIPPPCPFNSICCSTGACTPTPSPSPSPTPTPAATATPVVVPPSAPPTQPGSTPSPTPSPSPTPTATPPGSTPPPATPAPTSAPTSVPTAVPTAVAMAGWYHWELVGPPLAGADQLGTNGNPPPDPQCANGNQSFSPCFSGSALFCPPGVSTFACMDTLNTAIAGTSAFSDGSICNPDPGLQIPAICWSSGTPGNRTPPPSRRPQPPVLIDVTSRDGIAWRRCYIGATAPAPNAVQYAEYSLPADAPQILIDIRVSQAEPLPDSPYGCHNAEQ